MIPGAIAGTIDVAQLALIAFAIFFLGLVYHLRREDKREGYPLEDPAPNGRPLVGFPLPPARPKVFRTMHSGQEEMPHEEPQGPLNAVPTSPVPGMPLVPVGNPLLAGVGPGAWAMRRDEPLMTHEGHPQVAPLRRMAGWHVTDGDADPRGMVVIAADGIAVGEVVELWLDHGVKILRYLEVALSAATGPRLVLLPIYYTDIRKRRREIRVKAIMSNQFADVPVLRNPDQITAREEDRVNAYYCGGLFYATPERAEPVI
jgi:photosynthetic reaction center H subunit